jgi:hypothetical protein
MKFTKKKWIYGVSGGSRRKPYFPPIVPWISTDLREQLTDMLTRAMLWRENDIEVRIARLRGTIADYEATPELTMVQQRAMRRTQQELDTLVQEHEQRTRILEGKMRTEAANFCLLRGIREIHTEPYHEFLGENVAEAIVFVTAPIKIGGTVLGTYDIYLDPRQDIPRKAFDLVRRDYSRLRGIHPHFTSAPCYGTFGPTLQNMLKKGSFVSVMGAYLNYLATYNGGSPLTRLSNFRSGRMHENLQPLA